MKIADMSVEFLDHMGSDLTVVNAARVSFAKEHEEFDHTTDRGLIKYLAKHNHWSPFAHCSASFRVKAPIFVARQLVKHTVGFSWNEVSRRYVNDDPEFYIPEVWRKAAANVKQGSSEEAVPFLTNPAQRASATALMVYKMLLEQGVCAEQARMVLPQNTMTEWIWSGTLYAWSRMCTLRLDSHTQKETREVAQLVSSTMAEVFPTSWEFLMNTEQKDKPCVLLSSTPTSSPTKQQS
ncbi:THY1 Predicted alternative thymidylate synthase [uncultured Caudovirales phage]|uniref:THY1 Predicted alternative thymidylate synthase n=1 Tax=uncultured Caudovirales phage TaxID=2100421 RepID=A0A6J5LWU9_9CAUD|nr:THY1 Predicted alternative thymidylate synthase [uncultured Caudovirales phage]